MLNEKNTKWTIDSLKSKIKVLKDNEIYRMGDCLRVKKSSKLIKEIMSNPKYKDTILQLFLKNNKKDLLGIAKAFKSINNIETDDEILYVHIRLGDDFSGRCLGNNRNFNFFVKNINESNFKQVNIVTALHYGTNRFNKTIYKSSKWDYNDKNYINNITKVYELITKLNKPVEIISNINVDFDFVILVFCKNLLTSKDTGGFSKLVQKYHDEYRKTL